MMERIRLRSGLTMIAWKKGLAGSQSTFWPLSSGVITRFFAKSS
jgi:hypothetical protein